MVGARAWLVLFACVGASRGNEGVVVSTPVNLPSCNANKYSITTDGPLLKHVKPLACPVGFSKLTGNASKLVEKYVVSGCSSQPLYVAQVECKCSSGCTCSDPSTGTGATYLAMFWSNTSGSDGLPATKDAYAAYVRDRDINGRRIASEACYESQASDDEEPAPKLARKYDSWVSPADHVDVLASPTVRQKFTDLLEKAFNKMQMPGEARIYISGGTDVVDYGQHVTLGKQPYKDVFKGRTFKSRTRKPSLLKTNCCVRACSAKTGYPVMWDRGALKVPDGHPSSQRRRRYQAPFHTCEKVSSAPKDAHYVRVNPCFYEGTQPLCFLLKVTASRNASTVLHDRIRGWGEFLPTMSSDAPTKQIAVAEREVKEHERKYENRKERKEKRISGPPLKLIGAHLSEARTKLKLTEAKAHFFDNADILIREAIAALRFDVFSQLAITTLDQLVAESQTRNPPTDTPTTASPTSKCTPAAGMKIALFGGNKNKYCSDNGKNGIKCDKNAVGESEKFTFEDAGGGKLAFKGGKNGKYCADESNMVKCNRDKIGSWEKYSVEDQGKGWVALKGGKDGKYCADEGNTIKCNRNAIGAREKFTCTSFEA